MFTNFTTPAQGPESAVANLRGGGTTGKTVGMPGGGHAGVHIRAYVGGRIPGGGFLADGGGLIPYPTAMTTTVPPPEPPVFDDPFQAEFLKLIRWRRDVRRFRRDQLAGGTLERLISIAALAPSVGNSQPWRFVTVRNDARREAVRGEFQRCNKRALENYEGERARLYAGLKLSGLNDAPEHLAVFCDEGTRAGHGLGSGTMPETLRYSVVGAVQTLWLAARAEGIGLGWVSILEPARVTRILDVPKDWRFIGYLCIGYPQEEHLDPELERAGWQHREDWDRFVLKR